MRISFPGPDGQLLTVADPRRTPVPGKGSKGLVTLPEQRRPAGWLIATFRV